MLPLALRPICGHDVSDLPVGQLWQPHEHFAQICEGIDASPPTAFAHSIEDGVALDESTHLRSSIAGLMEPAPHMCQAAGEHDLLTTPSGKAVVGFTAVALH